MYIDKIGFYNNNISFGTEFQLSNETLKSIEKSTRLTEKELYNLSIEEQNRLMIKRGAKKQTGIIWSWLSAKYRQLGEKLCLLDERYDFYTDSD